MGKDGFYGMLAPSGRSHQFSWPRHSSSGEYYQVCVLCGIEYGYDWNSMRRLGRRGADVDVKTASAQQQAVRWMPRARRIRLFRPLRYRDMTAELWCDGDLKNIGKSGVLFAGSCPIPEGARIELEMEMPVEICGSPARQVRCIAHVVRTGAGKTANVFGAQIWDYEFVGANLSNA